MMTESGQSQNDILNSARKERKRIQIYLVNGIRVVGHVESFDQYVVMLRAAGSVQVIYKKAISTIQHDTGDARPSSPSSRSARSNTSGKPVVVTHRRRHIVTGEKKTD
jgi:host factor-I protein